MTKERAAEIIKGIDTVMGSLPEDGNEVEMALFMAVEALESKSESKWKKYDFIEDDNEWEYECMNCKNTLINYIGKLNYCPNCGVRMKGVIRA